MSIPQILQQLGMQAVQKSPLLGQIQNLSQIVKAAKNPEMLLQQMISQKNPQMQQAMDYVKQYGGDPKAAFEKLAEEQGIDPNEIMQMFK